MFRCWGIAACAVLGLSGCAELKDLLGMAKSVSDTTKAVVDTKNAVEAKTAGVPPPATAREAAEPAAAGRTELRSTAADARRARADDRGNAARRSVAAPGASPERDRIPLRSRPSDSAAKGVRYRDLPGDGAPAERVR